MKKEIGLAALLVLAGCVSEDPNTAQFGEYGFSYDLVQSPVPGLGPKEIRRALLTPTPAPEPPAAAPGPAQEIGSIIFYDAVPSPSATNAVRQIIIVPQPAPRQGMVPQPGVAPQPPPAPTAAPVPYGQSAPLYPFVGGTTFFSFSNEVVTNVVTMTNMNTNTLQITNPIALALTNPPAMFRSNVPSLGEPPGTALISNRAFNEPAGTQLITNRPFNEPPGTQFRFSPGNTNPPGFPTTSLAASNGPFSPALNPAVTNLGPLPIQRIGPQSDPNAPPSPVVPPTQPTQPGQTVQPVLPGAVPIPQQRTISGGPTMPPRTPPNVRPATPPATPGSAPAPAKP